MHHAYLVSGTYENLLAHLGELASGSDFWHGDFDTFGIDEGRSLKESAARKAMTEGGKKIFVITANSFTSEAQNSLLKLFEEPVPDTHFFILTPSAKFFLPTLLSRFSKLDLSDGGEGKEDQTKLAKDFLKKTPAQRIAFAAKLAKEENAKREAVELLESLIVYVRSRAKSKAASPEDVENLTHLLKYREYLFGRSPSVKMILEATGLLV